MANTATVAVEATEERFRTLKHFPSGLGFSEDGTARWPADQFTFRLRDDGAIRIVEHLNDPGLPAGVVPGAPPGWPVDATSGRLLDLDAETRAKLAATPLCPADGPAVAGEASPAPAGKPTAAAKAAPSPKE